MSTIEGGYRYFTVEEVETIIKEKRKNQWDVWEACSKLSEQQQENMLIDKSIIQKLTNDINNNRTIKLLEDYHQFKSSARVIEYVADLEDTFFKLTGNTIDNLEVAFSNKKERNGWLLIRYYLYEVTQEELEFDLSITEYKISQRRISEILTDTLDKLTKLLMMDR